MSEQELFAFRVGVILLALLWLGVTIWGVWWVAALRREMAHMQTDIFNLQRKGTDEPPRDVTRYGHPILRLRE
jgi:hypothetical protein